MASFGMKSSRTFAESSKSMPNKGWRKKPLFFLVLITGVLFIVIFSQSLQSLESLEKPQIFERLTLNRSVSVWPTPTEECTLGNVLVCLDLTKINLHIKRARPQITRLLERAVDLLKKNAAKMSGGRVKSGGWGMDIYVSGDINFSNVRMTLDTDESYQLYVYQLEGEAIKATIIADTYFGARHGLETLSQLIVFNDLRNTSYMVGDVRISEGPVYPYRGVLLDTSRNYIDKATILRTIEAMSMSKMNTFHWHIVDSQSFPYVSRTWPKFSQHGAYAPRKVYTPEDIKEIVDFGLVHGVRVLPEYDAPAHVGNGWQWVGNNATLCLGAEPWKKYCDEPPCGQLNPLSERVYEILEGIYRDMSEDFGSDIFHMGGGEVGVQCWNSSIILKKWMIARGWHLTEASFYDLWALFLKRAYAKLTVANGGKTPRVVLWTSRLTSEKYIHHLDPRKYIIQIRTDTSDRTVKRLVNKNFTIIFSNRDAVNLNCGFGDSIGNESSHCSSYNSWQRIYRNSPLAIIKKHKITETKKPLILGGELTLWSQKVDSTLVDSRLWPRSAAYAGTLWTDRRLSIIDADKEMMRHRERLLQRGIRADRLNPAAATEQLKH